MLIQADDFRGPPRGGRYGDRLDDRRGGGWGGRRDEPYGGYRSSRYEDRSYPRRDRDDGPRIDRYASSGRDDRYGGRGDRGDSRRGGGNDYYERSSARPSEPAGYAAESGGAKDYSGGRSYDDRAAGGEERYSRR